MRHTTVTGAVLLPLTIALAACSGAAPQSSAPVQGKAAHYTYIMDVSLSPATITDPAITRAVERRIGADMKRDAKLGDVFSVFEAGSADAARMVGHTPIVSGYNLRLAAAHAKLVGQLQEIAGRFHDHGGDNATHLTEALEAIQPDCASGRDELTLITDGVEESGTYSAARALALGKPVHLPDPSGRFLAGCHRITFLGFGLTDDGAGHERLLPSGQLAALRQGWLDYLTQAGVRAEDVHFVSAL
ncbi:hypothetical protein [Novosphingobium sp.]|uniref:hypothetical protein n=1 Tax=Novosphingobium sp. TaxID=1874826 RepID=UPI0038B8A6D1